MTRYFRSSLLALLPALLIGTANGRAEESLWKIYDHAGTRALEEKRPETAEMMFTLALGEAEGFEAGDFHQRIILQMRVADEYVVLEFRQIRHGDLLLIDVSARDRIV